MRFRSLELRKEKEINPQSAIRSPQFLFAPCILARDIHSSRPRVRTNYARMASEQTSRSSNPAHQLARRLGLFDAAMIVMGGIIGSGIFMNPYVVARRVHTAPLILGCWLLGGLVALAGAFIYAELAAQRPNLIGG